MDGAPGFDPLRNINHMASLISEVTGDPADEVIDALEQERQHPGRTVAREFNQRGGPRYVWGPHLEAFYSSTNSFLYELAVWNRNLLKATMRRWTIRHMALPGRPLDVLGIGDGLGFDCLQLARKTHRVTYFELPGTSEQFARKLFERTGRHIPILTDPAAIPRESFDAIICFDVLEHVPDPVSMVKTLASYLRPGGLLYVSAPFYMILPWYPTHLRNNRRFSGSLNLYRQAGMQLVSGRLTWYPIVVRKSGSSPMPSAPITTLGLRAAGMIQMLGRLAAWPFIPVHLLRRLGNTRYKQRPETRTPELEEGSDLPQETRT
jgi:2-polyprenyl-3-methyl-5-hydroxy-6-metoxy-1,4-benzoquinol methylase